MFEKSFFFVQTDVLRFLFLLGSLQRMFEGTRTSFMKVESMKTSGRLGGINVSDFLQFHISILFYFINYREEKSMVMLHI